MLFQAQVYYSHEIPDYAGLTVVQCPKCGSQMREDRHFQALGSEVELVSKDAFLGDEVKVFCCENCGYIELYRGKKRGF